MKFKNLGIFTIFITAVMYLSSCASWFDNDPIYVSDTCTMPIIVLEGEETLLWEFGKTWNDPGYHASEVEEGKDDLNANVEIKTDLDVSKQGIYTIEYIATNKYDYKVSKYRSVFVRDQSIAESPSIAGTYKKGLGTFMEISATTKYFYNVGNIWANPETVPVTIGDLGNNTFVIARTFSTAANAYFEGTAVYKPTTNSPTIVFSIKKTTEAGVVTNSTMTWKKQ